MEEKILSSLFLGNRLPLGEFGVSMKFYLPIRNILQHMFICAGKDTGKTVLTKIIAEEAGLKGIPSLMVDLKGDISSLALFLDSTSLSYINFAKNELLKINKGIDFDYEDSLQQLKLFDLSQEYIEKLRESLQISIFTPHSEYGIPIAFPFFPNPPYDVPKLYRENKDLVINLARIFSRLALLFLDKKDDREEDFVSQIILNSWLKGVDLEKREGISKFIQFIRDPASEDLNLEIDVTSIDCQSLANEIEKVIFHPSRFPWYRGIPLDIELMRGKFFEKDKTYIGIVNLSDLDSKDRTFFLSHLIFSVYKWMRRQQEELPPRLFFFLDEIGDFYRQNSDSIVKYLIDLLLKEGGNCGVSCILSSGYPQVIDYEGLKKCACWAIGCMNSEEREKLLENIFAHGIEFERIDTLIVFPRKGDFLIRLPSKDIVLVKERWLGSFHCRLPLAHLWKVMEDSVKSNFKAFYTTAIITERPETTLVKGKEKVLIPEIIFEEFDFGTDVQENFVMEKEPEEFIKMCLEELKKEGISAEELKFKNAQLLLARVYKANWRVDFLHRDLTGKVVDRVKREGEYWRVESPYKVNKEYKEKVVKLVDRPFNRRAPQICKKVGIIISHPKEMTKLEVSNYVSKELGTPVKHMEVGIEDRNVAIGWRFIIEYKKKFIHCFIDIIDQQITFSFPQVTYQEILEEVKKRYPNLGITEEDIVERPFFYTVNISTPDRIYELKISKNSGKIVKEYVKITEKRAKEIAQQIRKDDPFSVWKENDTWRFYYPDGFMIVINETNEDVFTEKFISIEEIERTTRNVLIKSLGEDEYTLVSKDFKEGKWRLAFSSHKWNVDVEVDENGEITQTARLKREFCLAEAKALLSSYEIPVGIEKGATYWRDGWSFDFYSPFGYFTVRVSKDKKELLKKRLTIEGIKHLFKVELKGEVFDVKDNRDSWSVCFKKKGKIYYAEVDKHDGSIQKIKVRQLFFWKEIDSIPD